MHLLRPELIHKNAILAFQKKVVDAGDTPASIFGNSVNGGLLTAENYEVWLKQVRPDVIFGNWQSTPGARYGNTWLLAENISDNTDVSPEYFKQFPIIGVDERLVGIITLQSVIQDVDIVKDRIGEYGQLNLCLIPFYRDSINYILALKDIIAYTVCEGLPYKYLLFHVPSSPIKEDICRALRCNNFDYKVTEDTTGEDVYCADLRIAHQLRDYIYSASQRGE